MPDALDVPAPHVALVDLEDSPTLAALLIEEA
jgi:hypothetical protein